LSSSKTKYLRHIRRLLEREGVELVSIRMRNHLVCDLSCPSLGVMFQVTFALSPSDYRAEKNQITHLRRAKREAAERRERTLS
jgi:polyferredoxin